MIDSSHFEREHELVGAVDSRLVRDALLDLCYELDLTAITADLLCERAGIDRAAFDELYGDLDECFYRVYAGELSRYRRQAELARAGLPDWRDRVRATAYALAGFLAEDERVAHFTVVAVRGAGERAQLLIGDAIEEMFDLLDEGRQELDDPDSMTRATAESVGGGIFNQIFVAAGRGTLASDAEIVPEMMYAAVLPYLGHEAAAEELRIPPPPQGDTRDGPVR